VSQYEWNGCDYRHHSKIEYQREVCIHESIDKQAVSTLAPPLLKKDESIQENQHCKIYEIFYQVLHGITSFHLPLYPSPDSSICVHGKYSTTMEANQPTRAETSSAVKIISDLGRLVGLHSYCFAQFHDGEG